MGSASIATVSAKVSHGAPTPSYSAEILYLTQLQDSYFIVSIKLSIAVKQLLKALEVSLGFRSKFERLLRIERFWGNYCAVVGKEFFQNQQLHE